jgi:hypothetical protein
MALNGITKIFGYEKRMQKLIDFTLDIAHGCKFSCTGCHIDKISGRLPSSAEFDQLDKLVDEMNSNGFNAMNLAIGPTDIMTAENRDDILLHPRIKNFANKFMKTTINCAFLEPHESDYVDLGKKLDWLLHGKMVKFVIPFEAFHIDNQSYIDKIREKVMLTVENMPNVIHTKTYLNVNYETTQIYDRQNNTNLTAELILKLYNSDLLDGLDVDLILPHPRSNLRNKFIGSEFIKAAKTLKQTLIDAREKYGIDNISIAEIDAEEGKDWDIIYKTGKLYMPPFLLEGLACFDKVFEIDREWSLAGLYDFYNNSFVKQVDWASTVTECKDCRFVGLCAERGIHNLMMITGTQDCISPAKDIGGNRIW